MDGRISIKKKPIKDTLRAKGKTLTLEQRIAELEKAVAKLQKKSGT